MQAVDRALLFVLASLSLLAVTPLWADTPERSADATVIAIVEATPETATNPINTDHTITATATDSVGGNPLVGYDVTFEVTAGPNTGVTGAGVTDTNGQATFTYNGGGPGDDSIMVCLFFAQGLRTGRPAIGQIPPLDCDTVAKTWVSPTPTASPTSAPTASAAATGTATATPATTLAPAQLPGTGSGDGGSSLPWVVLGVSAFAVLTAIACATALKRVR